MRKIIGRIAPSFFKGTMRRLKQFTENPVETQDILLRSLLQKAKYTEVGKQYEFSTISSAGVFDQRVPICRYEDIVPLIQRARKGEQNIFWPGKVKWFAKSSGTTDAKSKFILISKESLHECHYRAGKDMLAIYMYNNPKSRLGAGKSLKLSGSKELFKEGHTQFGDLSSILVDNLPFWSKLGSTPNSKISLIPDWEEKVKLTIRQSLKENVTSLSGVPSWMSVLITAILKETGKSHLLEIWPNLEAYFHGGVNFAPYKNLYEQYLPNKTINYYEVYNASEGFFATQYENDKKDLLLLLNHGVYYEFIPMDIFGMEEQRIIPLSGVRLNVNYAMIITTNSGLWRYVIGDTVRFTSLSPHKIKITGRTKHFINAFGEELMVENTDEALKVSCEKTDAKIVDYTVAPVYMERGKKGRHQWIIEFKRQPINLESFTQTLDQELQKLNSDYEAKRKNNTTLERPELIVAREDLFYDWMKSKGKLGGQNKVPRLSNDRTHIDELLISN